MPRLEILTGTWLAAALATGIGLFAGLEKHSEQGPGWGFWGYALAIVLAGAIHGLLHGLCLRTLCRGTRYFRLASLYPAALPNLPLLAVAGIFAWGAATESGKEEWFMAAAIALLVPTLWLTVIGWRLRRPHLYLAALATAGVPATLIGAGLAWALLASPVLPGLHGIGAAILFFFGCMASAVGLWYAQAVALAAWMVRNRGPRPRSDSEHDPTGGDS